MATMLKEAADDGVTILSRVIRPDESTLTPAVARSLLSLKFPKSDERRMHRLAEKARKGTLTDQERFVAEQYNLVGHLLALLKAQARAALQPSRHAVRRT